ncbi:chemotaxis protein CheW [Geotalea sp. SG265]|uniref:chemotaxis protein CheW n=1 Tax=Geotalea sp. SG265 TaxID=2922867 RepID=UPI001FAE785D|nr:chemotaxis protein CheW [Geotalea sp. SG265]
MNLAEIRKKAQQEKEALQAALAQLQDDAAESFEGEDELSKGFGGMLADGDAYFAADESCEPDESFVLEAPAMVTDGDSAVMGEGFIAPEDIFPEDIAEYFADPAVSGVELTSPSPCVPKTVSAPVIEEKEPFSGFDPLRVMLEGRTRAGRDDDAFIGPATGQEIATADSQELLCFRVATEEYALSIMEIKEIIKPREVTEVPRVPSFVSGVLSLRGIIIPVFDMNARLGLSKEGSTGKERIIVVKSGEEGFSGILVDEVVQVVRIEDRFLEPPPAVLEGIDRDFVSGIGRFHGRMLILLNMDKILDITLY